MGAFDITVVSGQRHFIVADPNRVLIDIIAPILPSGELARQYSDGVAAG